MATMKTLNGYGFDSAKLGGKAPEYYIQPRNLLDNSDFRNPVGQAGLGDGVYHGEFLYPADRWREWNAEATHQFDSDTGLTMSESSTFSQMIQIPLNRNYTIALGFSDGSILCTNGVLSSSNRISANGSNGNIAMYNSGGVTYFTIFFCTNCIWAAIYEGSYTADTLPPYVPKGYAAELAECQRYYRRYGVLIGFVFYPQCIATGVNTMGMRKNPTIACNGVAVPGTDVTQIMSSHYESNSSDVWLSTDSGFPTVGTGVYIYDLTLNADL